MITGVADRVGSRVSRLIYLETFLPTPERSFFDLLQEQARRVMQRTADAAGDGRGVRPPRWRWSAA